MVERITDPHRPVRINGIGRIPDGRPGPCGVPQPPLPEPTPTRYEWRVFWMAFAVVVLGVVIGALR